MATTEAGQPLVLSIDPAIYSLECVKATAHRFSGTHYADIQLRDGAIELKLSPQNPTFKFPNLQQAVLNGLLDDSLRLRVAQETRVIREEIVRAALGSAARK